MSSSPIQLSDAQLDSFLAAAAPLDVSARNAFLRDVASCPRIRRLRVAPGSSPRFSAGIFGGPNLATEIPNGRVHVHLS